MESKKRSSKKGQRPLKSKAFFGYLEGSISIIINTVLFGLKYWVGIATGSIAIVADAWHSLSDSLTSIVVILGFKISSKRSDRKHPFGHGRAELISSVIIGTLLSVVGFNFLVESVHRFIDRQAAVYSTLAIVVFIISIVLKEGMAQFSIRTGKRIDLRSLIADGWHHRSDSIASTLILVGILLGRFLWWIDSALGMTVSIFIFYAVFSILKDSISPLMGEEPDNVLKSTLKQLVAENGIEGGIIHHIHIHKYGAHTELTFHLTLPSKMTLQEAHLIANKLENKIRDCMDIEPTIHIEPFTI